MDQDDLSEGVRIYEREETEAVPQEHLIDEVINHELDTALASEDRELTGHDVIPTSIKEIVYDKPESHDIDDLVSMSASEVVVTDSHPGSVIKPSDDEISFDGLLAEAEQVVVSEQEPVYPEIELSYPEEDGVELDFSSEIREFWDNLDERPVKTEITGMSYDNTEVEVIDEALGLKDSSELAMDDEVSFSEAINQQISELANYEEHYEAEQIMESIEERLSIAIEAVFNELDAQEVLELKIDIKNIEQIGEIKKNIITLLDILDISSDEKVVDRFIELLLKEKIEEMSFSSSESLVDLGTHEKKTDMQLFISGLASNIKNQQERILSILGRISVLAS